MNRFNIGSNIILFLLLYSKNYYYKFKHFFDKKILDLLYADRNGSKALTYSIFNIPLFPY